MTNHPNRLYENLAMTAAMTAIDLEAKRRGHCVLIQELTKARAGWCIRVWAKGHESFDAFYERMFFNEARCHRLSASQT